MKRFCVRCGAEEADDRPIVAGLCPNCFVEVYGLVKVLRPIEVVYCPRCGAIRYEGKWIKTNTIEEFFEIVKDLAYKSVTTSRAEVSLLSIRITPFNDYVPKIHTLIEALLDKKAVVRQELDIPVIWKKQLCPTCFKRAGKSYEAVVQIRCFNKDKHVEHFKEELLKMFGDDIIDVEEVDKGYDIKVTSPFIARKIVDIAKRTWNCVRVIESYGDVRRRRDGKRTARLYISLRILNVKPGDYVVVDNRAYIVESVNENEIRLKDSDGRIRKLNIREFVRHYTR